MYRNEKVIKALETLEAKIDEFKDTEKYKEYLKFACKFRQYSINNSILIYCQCPQASYVAGFSKWHEMGRHVKAGEHGIQIIAANPYKYSIEDEDGNEIEKQAVRFKPVYVFDVSQTDGADIPSVVETLTGDIEGYDIIIQKLKNLAPVPVCIEYFDGNADGYYDINHKEIKVKTEMSEKATIATLVHEIAHSMLHYAEAEKVTREVAETEAESTAYAVCQVLGIDTEINSVGYIFHWAKRDKNKIKNSFERILKTSQEILNGLEV